MRPSFSAGIKSNARRLYKSVTSQVRRWFTSTYKLPPSSPMFSAWSTDEWYQIMLEDLYAEQDSLIKLLDNPDFRGKKIYVYDRLDEIAEALGEEAVTNDALVDQWERDIMAGKDPNLEY